MVEGEGKRVRLICGPVTSLGGATSVGPLSKVEIMDLRRVSNNYQCGSDSA
jgi:hypothetical protein